MAVVHFNGLASNQLHSKESFSRVESYKNEKPESLNSGFSNNRDLGIKSTIVASDKSTIAETSNFYKEKEEVFVHNLGYFIIPRSVTSDPRFQGARLKYQKVLVKIFELAAFAPTTHAIGTHKIEINVGQYCTTLRKLAEICNEGVKYDEDKIDKNYTERAIAFFEKCGFVRQDVRHGKSIITITVSEFYNKGKTTSETTSETKVRQDRDNKEEYKENKQVDCSEFSSPEAIKTMLKKIEIKSFDNETKFMSIEDIMTLSIQNRQQWSKPEIEELFEVLEKYKDPIRDLFKFCETTINNFRKSKISKEIKEKENRCNQKTYNQRSTKNTHQENKPCSTIKEKTSENDTLGFHLANWRSVLGLDKKSQNS